MRTAPSRIDLNIRQNDGRANAERKPGLIPTKRTRMFGAIWSDKPHGHWVGSGQRLGSDWRTAVAPISSRLVFLLFLLVILGRFSDGFAILPQRVVLNHTG